MTLFRALLLWAVMLAVPFQGYAAASMLGCAPGPAQTEADRHDHGRHHGHAAEPASATDRHDQHSHAAAPGDAGHGDAAHRDAAHKCGTCGTCHAVALISAASLPAPDALPPADLSEPAPHVATRTPRVLDKPPRA